MKGLLTNSNEHDEDEVVKLEGHSYHVNSVCCNNDGTLMASASNDGTIIIWDAKSFDKIRFFDGQSGLVYSVCFNHDGTMLASGYENGGTVIIWDVHRGTKLEV